MKEGSSKLRAGKQVMEAVNRWYERLPGFEDIFDEESFYAFAGFFTCVSIVAAIVVSRYITLKEKD